jgi:hypothetical protein
MLSSNTLLPNLIPLIDVTFSTPTPDYNSYLEKQYARHLPKLWQMVSNGNVGNADTGCKTTSTQRERADEQSCSVLPL